MAELPDAPWVKQSKQPEASDLPDAPWAENTSPKDRTWGGAALEGIGNIPESAVKFGSDIAQPFLHPINTAAAMKDLGLGVLEKTGLLSGQDHTKYADAVGKMLVDRYGSVEAVKNTLATDPVGLAGDLSMLFTGGGSAAARLPGAVGKIGETAAAAGRIIDPINVGTKGVQAGKYAVDAVTGGGLTSKTTARADIGRALARDEMTPAEAAQAKVPGRDPVLADVGGENTRGLMERVAQTPGAGRTIVTPFLMERQQQQASRIAGDLSELTGSHRTAFQAVNETVAERAKAAAPLYSAALEAGDREVFSPGLERLTASPTIQAAMHGAVRIWRDNAVADGFGAMNPGAMVERGGLLSFKNGQVPVFPNLQFWDYTKRLIDDRISIAKRSGQNQKVRTLTQLAQQLRGELDAVVPEYAAARAAWSGPSAYLDAIEVGRDILSRNVSAEEFAANFHALEDVEKEAVREGAVSSIVGRMGTDPAKLGDMTKYLRSPEMRKKIVAIMPTPEAAQKWEKLLAFETQSSEMTGQALKGSATARRLAEMQDAKSIMGDLVMDAFSSSPVGLLRRLTIGTAKKIRDTVRSRTDKEIARIMTSPAALQSLPATLSGEVRPHPPLLLKSLPVRGIGQAARQLGRAQPTNIGTVTPSGADALDNAQP
jgi:hypothetical protein